MMTVSPKQLGSILEVMFEKRLPILISGSPGVGKTDIISQAAEIVGMNTIISHPVVCDPTDAKGLPWPHKDGKRATFLPFGDLARALRTKKPTVWFLDDLGQATPATQASFMQLLLARMINDHRLPEYITFVAATNRRADRAGVQGILEPVKSRFCSIVELEPNLDDWCDWAMGASIYPEVIAFLRFRPDLLCDFHPTADMENSPCPRTWAHVSEIVASDIEGIAEYALVAGAVGEGTAGEFMTFLKAYREFPDLDEIIKYPKKAAIPDEVSVLYAVSTGLAARATKKTMRGIVGYAERLMENHKGEFGALLIMDSIRRDSSLTDTAAFTRICQGNSEIGQLLLGESR